MVSDLLADLLLRHLLVMLWLLPCALQDYRTRHVSNWLTLPLFVLAWPVALLTGNLSLALAVFIGVVVAWRWGGGMGPADGKIAVGLAGIAPSALVVGLVIEGLAFLYMRMRYRQTVGLPGVTALYIGTALGCLALCLWP